MCVTPISPQTSKLFFIDKCNLQVHFGSKTMASLYEILCHHSLTTNDPSLEELLCFLPTRLLHTFLIKLHMKVLITNQSDRSTLPSLHSTLTIQLTFLKYFFILFILYETPKILPQLTGTKHTKRPPAENNGRPGRGSKDPFAPKNRRHWRAAPAAPAIPGQSRRGTVGATADG